MNIFKGFADEEFDKVANELIEALKCQREEKEAAAVSEEAPPSPTLTQTRRILSTLRLGTHGAK